MSVKIMGQVWELDLPHNKLIVLLAMADHADHEGNNVYPSIGLIAWKTGYSTRTIQRNIEALLEDKILILVEANPGEVKRYRIDTSAGKQKPPYRSKKKDNPRQNVTPTPDTVMSPPPLTQLCHPTPDTAMSPEPSNKPSNKPSNIAPDKSDDKKPEKVKSKKRDILFDGIVAKAFRINPIEATKEQLQEISGRVGKIKKKLININPDFKEMGDDSIRDEIKSFWQWYKIQYDFDEAHLRSDVKWGEYYLEYHLNSKKKQNPSTKYYQAESDTEISENDKKAALEALRKGDD